jgi:hypothetical protein
MSQKNKKIFTCNSCNYNTLRNSDFKKHLLTEKHIKDTNKIHNDVSDIVNIVNKKFKCNCGKDYKFSQGLSKHKKKCNYKPVEENPIINTNFVLELIKKNQELQDLLIEQNKQVIEQNKQNNILINKFVEKDLLSNNITNNNNTNNNTINNNNQKFNLNFFLNETCKDAMNMKEFLDNIKITFENLLNIGNTGYVSGLSDIFVKKLKDLDITKRPIHCTDVKRETIYLKEEDKWNKDDKDNTNLKDIIKKVEYKNVKALRNWCNENPVHNENDNLLRDKIYLESLQGDEKNVEKVIKNISKEITIDKYQGNYGSIENPSLL